MNYLFIDTSSSNVIVAIIKDTKIVSCFNNKIDNDLSVKIFSIIETVFEDSGITPSDIDTIFVVNGPGSFTGVRIGVTIAKTYAWSLNLKVVPISSLELMATTNFDGDYIVPMIDARRNFVYGGVYDRDLKAKHPDRYIDIDELKSLVPTNSVYVSYDELNIEHLKPKIDLIKIIKQHSNDEGVNPHQLNPNYLKKTEAEENLNKDKI
ncbi:MAG: tRNA (adenosine(37)-N6)-threonylcarbamoyltransferase complex dimerization subunit type 1 TsaB [Bacilli bacterium]|nr:tRNA (adenosine(37)-N6)-threonylcarbamoyltransferase complex dimerization subunit type 1 TsaB [Bacilli bacterium]MDD4809512.1 tRNA (adenosine(37)-N6)-threonylcarbamoyltransferase complex dimerization subunit type 1 TsaB [Bacilli bacterium]